MRERGGGRRGRCVLRNAISVYMRVALREPMHLCTYVSEEGDDGETACSETPSLLSYTLRWVSFSEAGSVFRVALREPMHLCTCVREEGGDGEDVCSETPSLLSYTRRYVSFVEVGSVCRFAFREPMYLRTCVREEVGDREGAGEGGDTSNVL
jgi:hypothetical protein